MVTEFEGYAGQLVSGGTRPTQPVVTLEGRVTATTLANLAKVEGLMAKFTDVWIRDLKIYGNPLDPYITKRSARFGVGTEIAEWVTGVKNAKSAGECFPRAGSTLATQYALINYAHNLNVSIYDKEVDKAVMTDEEASAYAETKMRLPLKTIASMKYRLWKQLLSDPIDGTRSITSSTASDGTGTEVTYAPTIAGYAGVVDDSEIVLPALEVGERAELASGEDALEIYMRLKAARSDMIYEGSDYNKLGVDTFISGAPLLVMETKVLDEMDNAFAVEGGYKGVPSRSARESLGTLAEIVEIDSFADLPTNANYVDKRLAAVMLDREALIETVYTMRTATYRCEPEYYSGRNYNGESALTIYRGANSFALLTDTKEEEED